MSLKEPHLKMSKSHVDSRSRICINDPPLAIKAKINLALTDCQPGVSYDPVHRPGVSNLLDLLAHFDETGKSVYDLEQECSSMSMREFKQKVASSISQGLDPIRTRFERLICEENSHFLEDVAHQGTLRAQSRAQETMFRVRTAIGLGLDKVFDTNEPLTSIKQ